MDCKFAMLVNTRYNFFMIDYHCIAGGHNQEMSKTRSAPTVSYPPELEGATEYPATQEDPISKQTCAIAMSITKSDDYRRAPQEVEHYRDLLYEPARVEVLMRGTMHLIDTIIQQARKGERIDTLVFLDKSARFGGYLLNQCWSELTKRKEIPNEIKLPTIRYVNIGRFDDEKHETSIALQLLNTVWKQFDFEQKNVFIVDEIVASGGSLRLALKTFQEVFGVVATGIAQFKQCPIWYGAENMLGVEDRHIDWYVEDGLKRLNEHESGLLCKLAKATTKDEFSELIVKILTLHKQYVSSIAATYYINNQLNLSLSPADFKTICAIMNKCNLETTEFESIWEYVHTAGGFIISRTDEISDRANHAYFRQLLKTMVSVYMIQRDLAK